MEETANKLRRSAKIGGIAGLSLFMLGMLSVFLVYRHAETNEAVKLAVGAAVLLSLGCSTLTISGLTRLEARVTELERKAGITPPPT